MSRVSTRLVLAAGVLLGLCALAGWWLLPPDRDTGTSVPRQEAHAGASPRAVRAAIGTAPQRPSAGLRIRGTVVDVHGTPVAGARVSASWPEPGQTLSELPCPVDGQEAGAPRGPGGRERKLSDYCTSDAAALVLELVRAREGEAPVYAEATTGADGTFLLEALPEGPLTLWALAGHGAVTRAGIPAGTEGVELVLDEGLFAEGTVLGGEAPLSGATVTVLAEGHTRFFDATTGSDGKFRLGPLPEDERYYAAVMKEGWFPELEHINMRAQEIVLQRPSRISGRVVSGGLSVPGAEVHVTSGQDIPDADSPRLAVDAEGRFRTTLRAGEHTFSASHEGRYALAHVTTGPELEEVVLELGSALHVEGTVSDDAGRPVSGARVTATSRATYRTKLHAVTSPDGRYRMGPVEPGHWNFRVEAPGYRDLERSASHTLETLMQPADFTLDRAASVTGQVTDAEGRPVPGLQLVLRGPRLDDEDEAGTKQDSTSTDEQGRFVLDAEEAGDYRIEAESPRFIDDSFPVRAPSRDVHLTLRAGASVEGTVVDAQGLPLEDFKVELWDVKDSRHQGIHSDYTDAKGHFLIEGVKPGRYALTATRETPSVTRRAGREVELLDGARAKVELRMKAERSLSGIVQDGQGQPLGGVFVRAALPPQKGAPAWKRVRSYSCEAPPSVETGPDGRFTLRGLTEATYDVSALKPGYTLDGQRSTGAAIEEEDSRRVSAEAGEVRLVLARKPHVLGRVLDPEGAPVPRFTVNSFSFDDATGAFAVPLDSTDGEVLTLSADGFALQVRKVEPRTGSADVDLGIVRLSRGRTLRGRVLDAETDRPLSNASFMLVSRTTDAKGSPPETRFAGTSREDGTFELSNVDLVDFTLTARRAGYLKQQLITGPEQEALTVRLSPGARVTVTVTDRQGQPRTAEVRFKGDDGAFGLDDAENGLLVLRGLEPGPYTVRLEAVGPKSRFPVFLPQRVVVPASGSIQVDFREQVGGATVKLGLPPGGPRQGVALIPGLMPPPARLQGLANVFAQSLPVKQKGNDATFQSVPAGRATLFFIDSSNLTRIHREELDIPASGTLSRVLSPVWQPLAAGED